MNDNENQFDDNDFDTFLNEVTSEPKVDFDAKALVDKVEARFATILEDVDYRSLDDDEHFGMIVQEFIQDSFDIEPTISLEQAKSNAVYDLTSIAMIETAVLAQIKITLFSVEYDIANGTLNPEDIIARKAKLYTDILVKNKLDAQHPLLLALNKSIPGPEFSPESPELNSFYLASMEELANDEEKRRRDIKLVDEACVFLGIKPDDNSEVGAKLKFAIGAIVFEGRVLFNSQNESANREERIRGSARKLQLDEIMTQRIIQFIEEKFPVK